MGRSSRHVAIDEQHLRGATQIELVRLPAALRSVLDSSMAWVADGACLTHQEIDWFPADDNPADEAKAICRECTVKERCLYQAIVRHELGVWGGTTERERAQLRAAVPSVEPAACSRAAETGQSHIVPFRGPSEAHVGWIIRFPTSPAER